MAVRTINRNAGNGNQNIIPVGFHVARLTEAVDNESKGSGTSSVRLTFETEAGHKHWEHLFDTPAAAARMAIIAKRLGVLDEGDSSEEEVTVDFEQAVGESFVILIKHEKYQEQVKAKLEYAGVWPLDHEDKKVRKFLAENGMTEEAPARAPTPTSPPRRPTQPLVGAGAGPTRNGYHAPAAPVDDFDDI